MLVLSCLHVDPTDRSAEPTVKSAYVRALTNLRCVVRGYPNRVVVVPGMTSRGCPESRVWKSREDIPESQQLEGLRSGVVVMPVPLVEVQGVQYHQIMSPRLRVPDSTPPLHCVTKTALARPHLSAICREMANAGSSRMTSREALEREPSL